MAETTANQLVFIDARRWWSRVVVIAVLALVLYSAYYAVRWWYGNMMTETVNSIELAREAVALAPHDPRTRYVMAVFSEGNFLPHEQQEVLRQREYAVSLSPYDFNLWLDVARAREAVGDAENAEKALRRATELAPAYAQPHWLLGNLLLRRGRLDEAASELKLAGDADSQLRPAVFDIVMRLYSNDVRNVVQLVGNLPGARAQLIVYLLERDRLDDALQVWSSLDEKTRREQHAASEALKKSLFEKRRFHKFLEVHRDAVKANAPTSEAERNKILNSGFEGAIEAPTPGGFGWQIVRAAQSQIGIDTRERQSGERSLRILFSAPRNADFNNVSQLVVVEPGARYSLEYFVRTEELKSASTLVTQIIDISNPANPVLAAAAPLKNGTSEWQPVALDFIAPKTCEAILVRLVRPPCGLETCPIFGKVWYDDFNLQR